MLRLEEKLNLILIGAENSFHKDQLMNAIKRTQSMLSNAQRERIKTTVASKIQHSTLLQACTHKNNNQPFRENFDTNTGSGQVEDYDYDEPEPNPGSCNEYDILLKHLKTCPELYIQPRLSPEGEPEARWDPNRDFPSFYNRKNKRTIEGLLGVLGS